MQSRTCTSGCMIGEVLVNHLMYADDLVIVTSSGDGLQQLSAISTQNMDEGMTYSTAPPRV